MAGSITANLVLGYSEEERLKSKYKSFVINFRNTGMP
jgi:hypothetical protein